MPPADRASLECFDKIRALQADIDELAKNQKLLNELNWEALGNMPQPPPEEQGVALVCPLDVSDSGPSALAGDTTRLAFRALEASSIGSETDVGLLADLPYEDHSQGQTFLDRDNALFDPKDYDGGGGGIFTLSEQNVNRSVPVAAPSALAGVLVAAAEEADDEAMPGLGDESDDEEEPLGPHH